MTTTPSDAPAWRHHVRGKCGHDWTIDMPADSGITSQYGACPDCGAHVRWEFLSSTPPRKPPPRVCPGCGCRMRSTNPLDMCDPCDDRRTAATRAAAPAPAPRPAYNRDALHDREVREALRFIAAIGDRGVTRTRYNLRRRRGNHPSGQRLTDRLGLPWDHVVAVAIEMFGASEKAA